MSQKFYNQFPKRQPLKRLPQQIYPFSNRSIDIATLPTLTQNSSQSQKLSTVLLKLYKQTQRNIIICSTNKSQSPDKSRQILQTQNQQKRRRSQSMQQNPDILIPNIQLNITTACDDQPSSGSEFIKLKTYYTRKYCKPNSNNNTINLIKFKIQEQNNNEIQPWTVDI